MVGSREKKVIELFDEHSGEVIRVIRFYDARSFEEFLTAFRAMRYPGYGWRYKASDKSKGKKK